MSVLIKRGANIFEKRVLNNEYKEIPARIKEFRQVRGGTKTSVIKRLPVYSYSLDGEEYTLEGQYSYDEQNYTNEHVWGLYQDVNTGEVFEKPKDGRRMANVLLIGGCVLLAVQILPLMLAIFLF